MGEVKAVVSTLMKVYCMVRRAGNALQSPLLLAMRLFWGYYYVRSGYLKLFNFDEVVSYFTSLHIPCPSCAVYLTALTHLTCGTLFLIGLAARFVSIPLAFSMVVAYGTAELEVLKSLFHDPGAFVQATPFLFLLVALIIFAFGPGRISLDYYIAKECQNEDEEESI